MIRKGLEAGDRPVVLSSFGKDSIVLMHLVREQQKGDIPILWFRHEFRGQSKRHKFALQVIKDWQLRCFDYLPVQRVPLAGKGILELAEFYSLGGDTTLAVFFGTSGEYGECILDVGKLPTTAKFDYPWNVNFHGQRREEWHPLFGRVPLQEDGEEREGSKWFYPLRNWTLADIWEYTMELGLPVNFERYVKGQEEYDGDQYAICSACINPIYKMPQVYCPKEGKLIDHIQFADWEQLLSDMKGYVNANSGRREDSISGDLDTRGD